MSGEAFEVEGIVLHQCRGDLYEVDACVGAVHRRVLAKRSGRLVQNRIAIIAGDVVTVEVSAYDVSRGRITFRGPRNTLRPLGKAAR